MKYILSGLLILVIGMAGCSSPSPTITSTSNVSETTTPQPESSPPPIGWARINIEDIGYIDYPTDFLEIQSEEYMNLAEEAPADVKQIVTLSQEADFTLQQVGLNESLPSAFDEYRRVMLQTFYLNPGEEVFRAKEAYTMSQKEQDILQKEFEDDLSQSFKATNTGLKLVESVSLEVVEVNGMFPLVYTYKRQLNDNPVVLVQTYMFWNYDRTHHLSFSCRVVDEGECRDIYDKILDSFRLQ